LRSADGTLAEVPKNVSANILEAPASLLSMLVVQSATRLFSPTRRCAGQVDFRCRPAAGFFAAVSFDCSTSPASLPAYSLMSIHSAAEVSADRFTRVSPLTLSTVTCVSYQVSRGRAPKRSVSSAILASVNHASAARRFSHR